MSDSNLEYYDNNNKRVVVVKVSVGASVNVPNNEVVTKKTTVLSRRVPPKKRKRNLYRSKKSKNTASLNSVNTSIFAMPVVTTPKPTKHPIPRWKHKRIVLQQDKKIQKLTAALDYAKKMHGTNKHTILDLKIDNRKDKKASRIVICEVKRIAEVNVAHANSKARHLEKVVTKACRDIKSKAIEDIEEIRAQSQLCKKTCRDLHCNDKKENRAAISKVELQ